MISVLCVDDDSAFLEITKRFLEEPGALAVTTVLSAPEALKAMETNKFDAIIADYQMPGMDGIEFLRAVRAVNPHLPFILFTGKGREEVVIEAFNSGTDFYLQKGGEPRIRFAELKATIHKAVKIGSGRKEFHKSETRYRRLFETARDGILIIDAESGEITDANPLLLTLLGYTRDEILGKKLWELGVIRDKALAEQAATELKKTGYIRYDDLPLKTKDGRDIAVEFVSNVYDAETQNLIQCNIREITERKRAEEVARVNMAKYKVLFESIPLGITLSDKAGNIIESNNMAEHLLGLPKKDHLGRRIDGREWHIIRPDGSPMPAEEYASVRALKENCLVSNVEMGLVNEKGDITWISVTAAPIPLEGYGVAIAYSDITERKMVEELLRTSEEKFRQLFTRMPSAVAIYDAIDGGEDFIFKDFNMAAEKIEGIKKDDLIGKRVTQVFPGVKDFGIFAVFQRVWRTGQPEFFPSALYRDEHDPGTWRESWVYKLASGEVIAIYHDVTERKRAEEALKESENRLRLIFENAPVGITHFDRNGVITSCNARLAEILGASRKNIIGFDMKTGVRDLQSKAAIQEVLSGRTGYFEGDYVSVISGKLTQIKNIYTPLFSEDGSLVGGICITEDISERMRAEATLRESEERYRTLAEASPDQIFIDGRDETIQYVNRAALKLFHLSYDQVVGRPRKDLFPPEIFKSQEASLHKVFETGVGIQKEELIRFGTKDYWINTHLVPLKDGAGFVTSVLSIARDITERKQAEDALRESATLLNDVGEMAHVGGWELDVITKEVRWTKETYRIHEIAEDEKITLPEAVLFFDLPGRSTLEAALQRCMEKGEPFDLELPFTSAGGRHLWTRAMGRVVNVGGKVVKLTGTFQDITGRKAAEDAVRAFSENLERTVIERTSDLSDVNLKLMTEIEIRLEAEKQLTKTVGEKEVLIREVHHRVKNNLQIIISLLNLQSRYITDATTLSAFRESQNRVRAMALVHEKLYQSTDLAKIDVDNYIGFLANNLLQFFGMKGKGVLLTMDIKDIFLATDTAIPLGLIINELISNSLKYAFPGGRKGEISLAIQRQDHTLTILYKDNGVGIPDDFDWRNTRSMGLRLVIILVEQLEGTIELDRTAGTAFTIGVKEKE